jgi:hypothetical protein
MKLHTTRIEREQLMRMWDSFPRFSRVRADCDVQPMEKWRRDHGFDHGAFAVGYDAGEHTRIRKACLRGDDPRMTAWYPLVAWKMDRLDCDTVCRGAGMIIPKSSCFMCPNMREDEWFALRLERPDLFSIAMDIERRARSRGEKPQAGMDRHTPGYLFDEQMREEIDARIERDRIAAILRGEEAEGQQRLDFGAVDDRCAHGGCFT